jgi:hypothetical protein
MTHLEAAFMPPSLVHVKSAAKRLRKAVDVEKLTHTGALEVLAPLRYLENGPTPGWGKQYPPG